MKTQRLFRNDFNVGRHRRVPDRLTILTRVRTFRATASTQKTIGGTVKTMRRVCHGNGCVRSVFEDRLISKFGATPWPFVS